jgi:hypothetical protein
MNAMQSISNLKLESEISTNNLLKKELEKKSNNTYSSNEISISTKSQDNLKDYDSEIRISTNCHDDPRKKLSSDLLTINREEMSCLTKKNLTSSLTESFKDISLNSESTKLNNEDKYNVYGIGQNAAYRAHHERTSQDYNSTKVQDYNLPGQIITTNDTKVNMSSPILYNHTSRSLWEQGLNKSLTTSPTLKSSDTNSHIQLHSQLQTLKTPLKNVNFSKQVRLQTTSSPVLSPCLSATSAPIPIPLVNNFVNPSIIKNRSLVKESFFTPPDSHSSIIRTNQNTLLNQIRQNNLGLNQKKQDDSLTNESIFIPQSKSLPDLNSHLPISLKMTTPTITMPTSMSMIPKLELNYDIIKSQEGYGHKGFDDNLKENSSSQNDYSYSDSLYSDTYDDVEPEKETKTVTKSIMNDLRNVDIEESIKETADEIFRYIISLDPTRIFKVGNRRALIFYCIFEAFQRHNKKKASTYIIEKLGYQNKDKSKAFDLVSQIYALNGMKLVISDDSDAKDEITNFMEKMLKSVDHSSKIPISKQQMLNELDLLADKILKHSSELQEKMPRCTAAGIIFYYFSQKGFNITKKDVKTFTDTSTMTISSVCKIIQDLKTIYPHIGI